MIRDEFLEQIGCSTESSLEEIQRAYVIKRAKILAIIDPTSLDSQVLKYQNTLNELDTACQDWYPEVFKNKQGDDEPPFPRPRKALVWKKLLWSRKFIYATVGSLILVIALLVGFGLGMMYESKRNEKRMRDLLLQLDAAKKDNEQALLKVAQLESELSRQLIVAENEKAVAQAKNVQLEQKISKSGVSGNGDPDFRNMKPIVLFEVLEIYRVFTSDSKPAEEELVIKVKSRSFNLKGESLHAVIGFYHLNDEIVRSSIDRFKAQNGQLCDWKILTPATNTYSQIIDFQIPYSAFDLRSGHWKLKFLIGVQNTKNSAKYDVPEWGSVDFSL